MSVSPLWMEMIFDPELVFKQAEGNVRMSGEAYKVRFQTAKEDAKRSFARAASRFV